MYLRPGELETICCQHLVPPVPSLIPGRVEWTIVLHTGEMSAPSKTQEFDETMAFDVARQSFLGPALQQPCKGKRGADRLFGLSTAQVSQAMRRGSGSARQVGIVHVYQLRHGGASHDCVSLSRTLTEVRRRGRWRSWHSVRRYEKGSRMNEVLNRLSPAQKLYADKCVEFAPAEFLGQRSPLAPPWCSGWPSRSSAGAGASRKCSRSKGSAC